MSKAASNASRQTIARDPHVRAAQGLLILACLIIVWLFAGSPLGHLADNNVSDTLFRWLTAGRERGEPATTLLAIDEATLNAHGGMRNLRGIVADTLQQLAAAPPRVTAIDLTLADAQDPGDDQRLARAIATLPNVVLAAEIRSSGTHWEQPLPDFANGAAAIGHVHAAPDPMDAVCREIPLEKAVERQRYWSLSLEAYRLWRDETYVLETPESLIVGSMEITAPRDQGRLLRISYIPPRNGSVSGIPRISVADLLRSPELARSVAGKAVFLGITAQSAARDRLMTPYSYGRTMQGVEIHANAFETLAGGRFLQPVRPGLQMLVALMLAAIMWFAFTLFQDYRTYLIASVGLACALILPGAAFVERKIVSSSTIVGSAWMPFLALAGHRYWFINKRLKRAQRETENYRDAIHYVTHEMRTPLTAIQGSSELISRYRLSEEKQKQIASTIHSESKRLGRLIQVFLDVERLSAGEMQLRTDRFPAGELFETCLQRVRPLAEQKEIALVFEPCPRAVEMRGDRELLEHAVYNLLTNAVKYSPSGTTVTLRCGFADGQLQLAVTDQGIGMNSEELRSIFRKFYRTESAERSGEKGSGIGLSIVEQIVTAHAGRIHVESEPGKGSTFTVLLPAADSSGVLE